MADPKDKAAQAMQFAIAGLVKAAGSGASRMDRLAFDIAQRAGLTVDAGRVIAASLVAAGFGVIAVAVCSMRFLTAQQPKAIDLSVDDIQLVNQQSNNAVSYLAGEVPWRVIRRASRSPA